MRVYLFIIYNIIIYNINNSINTHLVGTLKNGTNFKYRYIDGKANISIRLYDNQQR